MIPTGGRSTTTVPSQFADSFDTGSPLIDIEYGGIAINDASMGLMYQPWTLRYDAPSGDMILSPRSGTPTVLFNRSGITEVSLAFDRNMQPAVAFVQNGQAKFYFYSPIDDNFVMWETQLGQAKNPKVTHDDKRDTESSRSDVILAYVMGNSIRYRQQRDRYLTEYTFATSGVNALYRVGMNKGGRLQFMYDGTGESSSPFLADIVLDLMRRVGVSPYDVDVSDLYTRVLGYKVATQSGVDTLIQPLRQAFFFDVSEYDKKIRFPMRGGPAVAQVSIDDMMDDHGNSPLHMERVQEAELLRKVSVISIDPAAGYAAMTQSAERRSNTVMATSESTTEVPITMSSDEAATVASKRIKVAWGELHKADFRLGVPWTSLTPADVIEVTDKRGARYRMRVVSVSEDTGQIEIEAIEDADFAYRSSASGITPAPPRSTTPGLVGETTPIPMNLPSLRTSDNVPGIYVATVGGGTGWTGAEFWLSADDGQTYSPIGGVDIGSTVGTLDTAITAATDPFSVTLDQGELFNATPEQLAARQNAFAILTAGVAEIGQFANATEGAPLQYDLDTITRGLLDTTAAPHDAGDRFVLLDDSVVFLPIDQSFSGRDLLIKAVSFGQTTDEATAVSFRYDPKSGPAPAPSPTPSQPLTSDSASPPQFLTNEAEDDFIYSD